MAIIVQTPQPNGLLRKIKEAIDAGNVSSWSYDRDGDFVYDAQQWTKRAWMRGITEPNRLIFGMIGRKNANATVTEYAVYHSRFLQMLLTHFDHNCVTISVTPFATKYDSIFAQNSEQ